MTRECLKCGKSVPPGAIRCTHCEALMPSEVLQGDLSTRPGVQNRWEALESLGTWSGQKVYRVKNRTTGIECALRMLPVTLAGDDKVKERMSAVIGRQAGLAGLAGVLPIDKYEVEDRTPFFVHGAVRGETLQDRLKRDHRLPAAEVRRIGVAVAEILGRAHAAGVQHGDLRSTSVLLGEAGEVVVTDFGVGKVVADASARALDGGVGGPRGGFHRSPEIRKTELPTVGSDLYALGCLLFEAVSGERRFPDAYRHACDDPHKGVAFPDPCVAQGDLEPPLRSAIRKLLAPHAGDRFPDAAAAAAAIRGGPFIPVPILDGGAKFSPPAGASAAHAPPPAPAKMPAPSPAPAKVSAPPPPPAPPKPAATAPAAPPRPPQAPPKKSGGGGFGKLLVGIVLVAGGAGAGWWFSRYSSAGIGRDPATEEIVVKDLGPAPPALPDLPPPPPSPLGGRTLPDHVVQRDGRLWSNLDGAELVFIPEGAAILGADDGAPDEQPSVRVAISAYLIDRHEVTVAQYIRFCDATGRPLPTQPATGGLRHPVVNVSWNDADAFARWAKRRLPTEAEWERAARGPSGNAFPWGAADDAAKRNGPGSEDGWPGMAPCGSILSGQSPFGVIDAIGNAWEWCADWYSKDAWRTGTGPDPQGPSAGTDRVTRGGSFLLGPPMRASFRNRAAPSVRFEDLGFRCVLPLR